WILVSLNKIPRAIKSIPKATKKIRYDIFLSCNWLSSYTLFNYLFWSFTTLIFTGGISGGKIPISLIFFDIVDSILSFISSVLVSANLERNSLFCVFKSAILNNFCSNRWVFAIITIANKTKKMINLQCLIASSSIRNFVLNMLYKPPFIILKNFEMLYFF